jgi:hypothetical protein
VKARTEQEAMMSSPREGGCACGQVRYRLTSDPLFVHCCHCLNCQRQTGSAFVVNLLIEADRVELLAGEPQPVPVPRSGGKTQRSKLPWVVLPGSVPAFEVYYDTDKLWPAASLERLDAVLRR